MAVRQYIGARYVTKVYENTLDPSSAEWESGVIYEPLTLVTYNYSSYLSKKEVPANIGDPAANPAYWVLTGAYNGQILNLQNQVDELKGVVLTPEQFGAVGDGNHDDTDAINAAFEALTDGGVVMLSNGKTYKITANVMIRYSNQTLYGYGATITTDNLDGASYAISARDRDYLTDEYQPLQRLDNIKILGVTVEGGQQECCYIANCDHVTIKDCKFVDSQSDTLAVYWSTYVDIDNCYVRPVTNYGMFIYQTLSANIHNCVVDGQAVGITIKGHPVHPTEINNVFTRISDNTINIIKDRGHGISTGVDPLEGDVVGLSITNNTIIYKGTDYADGLGVRFGPYSRRNVCKGNRFFYVGILANGDHHDIVDNYFESFLISGRAVIEDVVGSDVHSGYHNISDNYFMGSNVDKPFILTNHTGVKIHGNYMVRGRGGFDIMTASPNNEITNNFSALTTNGQIQEYGTLASRNNTIRNNTTYSSNTGLKAFELVATDDIFENNLDKSYFVSGAPVAWYHYKGEYKKNAAPSVLGTAGSQYVITGWLCTASGTPGTWTECRAMTGT